MQIQENIKLAPYTTFKIGGKARYFVEVDSEEDLKQALEFAKVKDLDIFVLGEGSNIVISDNGFDGLVIRLINQGIEVLEDTSEFSCLKIASGEVWDDVVQYAVDQGLWGIENLSYIPGLTGAAAVQNIMAYGQQLSDSLEYLEVYDKETQSFKKLTNKECEFSYKKSIFNSKHKNRYLILNTVIKLKKSAEPVIKYPDVINYFKEKNIAKLELAEMRMAIVNIRVKKFGLLGQEKTDGSFFANLVLKATQFDTLHKRVATFVSPEILSELDEIKDKYVEAEYGKLPVAFIIDKVLDLKGTKVGGAVLSQKQGNVIINESGKASAHDVMGLFSKVRQLIYKKTGLEVTNEPELVGFSQAELDKHFELK